MWDTINRSTLAVYGGGEGSIGCRVYLCLCVSLQLGAILGVLG